MQTSATLAPGTWAIDPSHTTISFAARHLMAARVRGSFKTFNGRIVVGDTPETSTTEVTIDASSIDTGVEDRDNHLRSGDFLDVENHPDLTFESTKVVSTGEQTMTIEGDLTIRGVTHPVSLAATFFGVTTDPWGNDKAMFSATTSIDREVWGLTWNQALETGGWLVGKKVEIEIELQAMRVEDDADTA